MVSEFLPIMRSVVVIAVVVIGACACAPRVSNKPLDLESLTADAQRRAQLVRQFEVQFVKTRRGALFNGDMTVKGHLVFQKPNKFSMSLRGDVNVEVLSDGTAIKVIHDQKDEETYHIEGERDLARFADPLMALIRGLGSGELRRFSKITEQPQGDLLMVELAPGNGNSFERIKRLALWFSARGEIKKAKIDFSNGDEEETIFESWSLLTENSAEIRQLRHKLSSITRTGPVQGGKKAPSPDFTCDPAGTGRQGSSSQISTRRPRMSLAPSHRTRVEPTLLAWGPPGRFPGRCLPC